MLLASLLSMRPELSGVKLESQYQMRSKKGLISGDVLAATLNNQFKTTEGEDSDECDLFSKFLTFGSGYPSME